MVTPFLKSTLLRFLGFQVEPDPLSHPIWIRNRNKMILSESRKRKIESGASKNKDQSLLEDLMNEIAKYWAGPLPDECKIFLESLIYSDVFEEFGLHPKGLLFLGEPGTASSIDDKYVGSGARKFRELFNEAFNAAEFGPTHVISPRIKPYLVNHQIDRPFTLKKRYSLIFIDELDSLGNRSDINRSHSDSLNQLLALMQGVVEYKKVIVFGATSNLDKIDLALKRTGRFDNIVVFKKPNHVHRLLLIELYMANCSIPITLDKDFLKKIACYLSGFSCSDIATLVNEFKIELAKLKYRSTPDFDQAHCFIQVCLKIHSKLLVLNKNRNVNHSPDLRLKTLKQMSQLTQIINEKDSNHIEVFSPEI